MKERKLTKKIASIVIALAMVIGCLSYLPMMAGAVDGTVSTGDNKATVYYYNASYTNAYIHYQVDNGSWTTVPGVKMESNTNGNGYKWKYEINLGSKTGATVCFNNGNGSWDSKNGANYKVGVGSYGVKNGAVNKLVETGLSVSVSADKSVGGTFTTTKFTAVAQNGTAPYTYKFAWMVKGTNPTSTSYTSFNTNNTYSVTPQSAKDYTLYVVAQDAAGKTAQTSINYTVEGPKWGPFTATASDKNVGTPVTLEASFLNFQYDRYNSYAFIVEKDGVSNKYSADTTATSGKYVWTPTEAGTYNLTAQFLTFGGAVYETKTTYKVNDPNSSNEAVVYYSNSSWSQAYIHYKVGNGSWTSVPGKKMSTNPDGNGYTWKYVIDLGTATEATVCFNNGNNSWDSNNGSNYKVYPGGNGIKNGKRVDVPLNNTPVVSVTADKIVGGTHTTTTFTVKATNGTAPYTYKLAIIKDGMTVNANSYFTINSAGTYQYTPLTAGNYTVYAKVIDKNGKEAVTSMSYKVEGAKWGNVTATASNNKLGTPVTLKAEYLNYQYDRYNSYSFKITKNGVSTEYSAGATGTYVWTPSEAGTYTITAIFSTFTGARYEKQITYTVQDTPNPTVSVTADKAVGGTHTTTRFTVKATGGTAPYTYKIAVVPEGTVLSASSYCTLSSNGTYDFTPYSAKTYTVYGKVIDANGKEAVKNMNYVVEGAKWGNVTATSSNNKIGTPVTLKAEYLNYQYDRYNSYSFKITKNGVSNTYSADSTGTYVWTPSEAGTYTITAIFSTFTGSIYEKQITYTVQDAPNPTITTLKADKSVGGTHTTTTFTVKASNGTAPYTYKLAIMKDGMAVTANSYFTINSAGTYQYTPLTAGNYTVYAKVIDKNGKEAVTSMSYKVEGAKWGNVTATSSNKKVGTPVTLKAEYLNYQYDRYNSYSFKITKNGVSNTYSADSTGKCVWTPSEAGTYTITAIFSTFTGARYEKQITYTAEAVNTNTVTIYYSTGWSKANIHYSIGGGSWTAVPGVTMTKTSERSGYTHKIVLDLGTSSYATICFNNGSGSWDSRNGQNYKVYAGVYGVKNGQVSKLN